MMGLRGEFPYREKPSNQFQEFEVLVEETEQLVHRLMYRLQLQPIRGYHPGIGPQVMAELLRGGLID